MNFAKTGTVLRALTLTVIVALVAACSGGGGGGENANPPPSSSGGRGTNFVYSGPAPRDGAVLRFQQNFYNNLVNDDRCGSCHTRGGPGVGAFVDHGDVNVAYDEALKVVTLDNPPASRVVAKVTSGHNCWTTPAACRVLLTSYIEGWAADGSSGAVSVRFNSPTDRDPNGENGVGFRAYPATAPAGYTAMHAVLTNPTNGCVGCHRAESATAQQPYFASADINVSYTAVQPKIDLNTTTRSRLYLRLRDEHHNCWTASCANDAQVMLNAINAFAGTIPAAQLDAAANRSQGQQPNDGIIGSSGGRFELYQIALWQFKEGSGNRVSDTSGVAPGIELTVSGSEGEGQDYQWVSGWGMQFYGRGGVASAGAATSSKLFNKIKEGGEYSVEGWLAPANISQNEKQIFAYGDGTGRHNAMLGQSEYRYEFFNRTPETNANGAPALAIADDEKGAKASLQHVVVTYSPTVGRRIYVDGEFTGDIDSKPPATLAGDWSDDYGVFIGGTRAAGGKWSGVVKMLSVHNRALSAAQVAQNFEKGVGEKRYVMFNVSHVPGVPAQCADGSASYCYIVFEVSQFDNYSYLFNKPLFISLDPTFVPVGMTIKGIRIGMNGQLAAAGQAYIAVDKTINNNEYRPGNGPESGQLLYDRGTIVARGTGPDTDLFYLEFDKIGDSTDRTSVFVPPPPMFTPMALNGTPQFNAGWKLFDSINYTFSNLTGVSPAANDANSTRLLDKVFASARQSLPASADYSSFLASHQTAIAQLAIGYCDELIKTPTLRDSFFNPNGSALSGNSWDNLINPLATKFFPTAAQSQPVTANVAQELRDLILYNGVTTGSNGRKTGLCVGGCAGREVQVATAACAGALGSAALTAQ